MANTRYRVLVAARTDVAPLHVIAPVEARCRDIVTHGTPSRKPAVA